MEGFDFYRILLNPLMTIQYKNVREINNDLESVLGLLAVIPAHGVACVVDS
jgi:hypothetical protein